MVLCWPRRLAAVMVFHVVARLLYDGAQHLNMHQWHLSFQRGLSRFWVLLLCSPAGCSRISAGLEGSRGSLGGFTVRYTQLAHRLLLQTLRGLSSLWAWTSYLPSLLFTHVRKGYWGSLWASPVRVHPACSYPVGFTCSSGL